MYWDYPDTLLDTREQGTEGQRIKTAGTRNTSEGRLTQSGRKNKRTEGWKEEWRKKKDRGKYVRQEEEILYGTSPSSSLNVILNSFCHYVQAGDILSIFASGSTDVSLCSLTSLSTQSDWLKYRLFQETLIIGVPTGFPFEHSVWLFNVIQLSGGSLGISGCFTFGQSLGNLLYTLKH